MLIQRFAKVKISIDLFEIIFRPRFGHELKAGTMTIRSFKPYQKPIEVFRFSHTLNIETLAKCL